MNSQAYQHFNGVIHKVVFISCVKNFFVNSGVWSVEIEWISGAEKSANFLAYIVCVLAYLNIY